MKGKVYSETLIFKIEPSLATALKEQANNENRPVSRVVRRAIESYLSVQNKSAVTSLAGHGAFVASTN